MAEFWMVSRIANWKEELSHRYRIRSQGQNGLSFGKVGEEFYGYNRFWDGRGFLEC